MFNRLANYIDARRMSHAARVFEIVEDRFDAMLETHLENTLEGAFNTLHQAIEHRLNHVDDEFVNHIAADLVNARVQQEVDIDDLARSEVESLVENHDFDDFDDIAREAVNETVGYDLDLDDTAREKVDDWFSDNDHSVRTIVENNIRRQVDETLEDAPHLVARVEELEAKNVILAERVAQALEMIGGFLEHDARPLIRTEFVDLFVQMGRVLELDLHHHPAFEGVDQE